jgi:hypothetical protein
MPKPSRSARTRGARVPLKTDPTPRLLHPDAAGIDIGATHLYVALPPERAAAPVRVFETFTEDLHALAAWLQEHQITTVAMESTGVIAQGAPGSRSFRGWRPRGSRFIW